jgi:hypothetical protein
MIACVALLLLSATPAAGQLRLESTPALQDARPLSEKAAPSETARVLATFAGALIGYAAPALVALADGPCVGSLSCFSGAQGLLAVTSGVLGPTLATGGHVLLGGRAGAGAALLGASAAAVPVMATHMAFALALQSAPDFRQSLVLYGTDVAMAAVLTTIALEIRHSILSQNLALEAPWQRVLLETLPFGLSIPLSVVVSVVGVLAIGPLAFIPALAVQVVGLVGTFLVHRLMGGKGQFIQTVAAYALSVLVGTAAVTSFAFSANLPGNSGFNSGSAAAAATVLGLGILVAPSYALEFGHAQGLSDRLNRPGR